MKKIVAVLMGLVVAAAGILLLIVGKRMGSKPAPVVIGGANGPTSIFIAGKISGTGLMETGAILLAVGLVIELVVLLIIRLKRKERIQGTG